MMAVLFFNAHKKGHAQPQMAHIFFFAILV